MMRPSRNDPLKFTNSVPVGNDVSPQPLNQAPEQVAAHPAKSTAQRHINQHARRYPLTSYFSPLTFKRAPPRLSPDPTPEGCVRAEPLPDGRAFSGGG